MRCALINLTTNVVENIILANPAEDPAPEGFAIIDLSDTPQVTFGWYWDGTSFTNPNAEVATDPPN